MAAREREIDLTERMSEHEALMWNIEKDPWLNPSGASLTLLDRPVDMELFRRVLRSGVAKMPRLYQRVVPGLGRLSTPAWVPDPEFDFDYHVREVELPAPGTRRQLLDLAAQLYEEPLDRTRPLWRFVSIRGIEGGQGAVWAIVHHAIADGIGQLRMAELYQQLSRDEEPPPEVDLDAVIAEAVAEHGAKESGGDLATSLVSTTTQTVSHLARRQAGIGRRVLGELMMWPADLGRATEKVGDVATTARSTTSQLTGSTNEVPGGSPLWKERSRHRHLEFVQIPLDGLKAASKELGGTINDAFMIGLTEAAVRYHEQRDTPVEAFNTSFVVSTRSDNKAGGNAFTPVLVQVPGAAMSFQDRMARTHEATEQARAESDRSGGISGLSGVINLLPTSVVTRTARSQAARIDFATSNLRGAPFPLYCAGGKVLGTVCMGPVAGTAANATALSYDGSFDIGLFLDPTAIDDPDGYRRCVESAFADLLEVASPSKKPASKKPASKKPASKKAASRKPASKKAASQKTPAEAAAP